jgi:hypothetical protein
MITSLMYFGQKAHSAEHTANCFELLRRVNGLLMELEWPFPVDPDTGAPISGSKGGSGDGGFRLSTSTTGRAGSKHKYACAVDVFDPDNELDNKLTDELLQKYDLYREHPDDTPGWCHLQSVPPGSGKRTFKP